VVCLSLGKVDLALELAEERLWLVTQLQFKLAILVKINFVVSTHNTETVADVPSIIEQPGVHVLYLDNIPHLEDLVGVVRLHSNSLVSYCM
jgi:hypothetical protein